MFIPPPMSQFVLHAAVCIRSIFFFIQLLHFCFVPIHDIALVCCHYPHVLCGCGGCLWRFRFVQNLYLLFDLLHHLCPASFSARLFAVPTPRVVMSLGSPQAPVHCVPLMTDLWPAPSVPSFPPSLPFSLPPLQQTPSQQHHPLPPSMRLPVWLLCRHSHPPQALPPF